MDHILLVLVFLLVKLIFFLLLNLDLVVALRGFVQSHLVQWVIFAEILRGIVFRIWVFLFNLLQLFELFKLIFIYDYDLLTGSFLIYGFLLEMLLLLLFVTVNIWIRSWLQNLFRWWNLFNKKLIFRLVQFKVWSLIRCVNYRCNLQEFRRYIIF